MNALHYITRHSEESPMHNYALTTSISTDQVLLLQRYNVNEDAEIRQIMSLHGLKHGDIFNGSESDSDESRAADLLSRREGNLTLDELLERAALLGPVKGSRERSWSVPIVQVLKAHTVEPRSWRWVFWCD